MKTIDETDVLSPSERQMLAEVKEVILRIIPDAKVMLYGSAVRGERDAESDYDVLVLHGGDLSLTEEEKVIYAVYDVELARDAVVSLVFFSEDEWSSPLRRVSPYHKAVESEGLVF